MIPSKFRFIWLSSFRGEDFLEINQSETRIVCGGCLLTDRDEMSNLYRGPSKDASYQVSVHFGFRGEQFKKNQPIRNKNCLWWPCLLTDRDKINNIYRGPSIDASCQISVHLEKWFQRRRFFRNQPIKNKNGLWRPCLLRIGTK